MAYFRQDQVETISGTLKTYEHRSDESNRRLRMGSCPNCGTTVAMTVETLPGTRGIAGGTFDDPSWLQVQRHTWLRSAQPWVVVPPGVEQFDRSSFPPPRS
jgi:hypothetical protein